MKRALFIFFGAIPLLLALLLAACDRSPWPPVRNASRSASQQQGWSSAPFAGASAAVAGKGDTVYILSRRHGVSIRAIIEANRLKPPYHLMVGQRVVLPREARHVVRLGDTLYSISRTYNVDTYALARANGVKPPYTIIAGESLRIPNLKPNPRPNPRQAAAKKAASRKKAPPKKTYIAAIRNPKSRPPTGAPGPRSGRGFLWPVKGKVLSGFGPKAKGLHNDGINIAAKRGAPVRAAENGVVAYAGNELRGFGNLLLIKHSGGWITAYAHNSDLLVKRGQRITKGQTIAKVGSTGSVTRPQLHFEIRKGKRAIDPRKYLTAANVQTFTESVASLPAKAQ